MKIDRLLSIIMLLLNRDRVTAAELARHFEVAVRTVYRDLESIDRAGIPIVAFQGNQGGYGIHESYRLDRRLLTLRDMAAILSALRGVSPALAGPELESAAEKVRSLVPAERRAEAELLQEQIIVDILPWGCRQKEKPVVAELRRAVERRRLVEFDYLSNERGRTRRMVEPHTLVFKGYAWYLYAYCRLRADFRLFRVSRLRELRLCGETFVRRERSYNDFAAATIVPPRFIELAVKCQPAVADNMEDYVDITGREACPDGRVLIRGAWPEGDWLYSMLLGLGDAVELIEPAGVRAEMARRARATAARYDESAGSSGGEKTRRPIQT